MEKRDLLKITDHTLLSPSAGQEEILRTVEESARSLSLSGDVPTEEEKDDSLITLADCASEAVIEELKKVDLNTLSPFECMSLLFDLKKRLL